MQKDFSFTLGGQTHEAIIIGRDTDTPPAYVFIHGAGQGSKERIYTHSDVLEKAGISMLAFDQSGAGKDKDNLKQSSLERRFNETLYAIKNYASKDALTICGSSMGGEIAIRLLEHVNVKNLILIVPAVYDRDAFLLKFGEGFTEVIRKPNSWENAASLKMLEKYTGKLLIVTGELDEVIPKGVIDAINKHATNVLKKEIYEIPGCPHKHQEWLNKNPHEAKRFTEKILEYSL